MNTLRENREAELRQLLKTKEGQDYLREMYEQVTGTLTPPVTYIAALIPEILDHEFPLATS
jgi:hypothetical protein